MSAEIYPEGIAITHRLTEDRIEALDVIRGFALFGIFLMNVEYFNRSLGGLGTGMPLGLTGLDWVASWFVAYFVQGKFWTIFSMLFGMGFAVMATRAERAGRPFLLLYLRRVLGLAVFGAAHFIFLWGGDILFSYAVGAIGLLILLYSRTKLALLTLALLVGIGFIPEMDSAFAVASTLGFILFFVLYLRVERKVRVIGRQIPVFSLVLTVVSSLGIIGACVLWLLPEGPKEPRIPVTIVSIVGLIFGVLSGKYHDPASLRRLRLGAAIYAFSFLMMASFGAVRYFETPIAVSPAALAAASKALDAESSERVGAGSNMNDGAGKSKKAEKDKEPKLTDEQKAAKKKVEQAKRIAKQEAEDREEVNILSKGSYLEAVEMRARKFPEKVIGDTGFGMVLIAMFLIGSWFVRSGIMDDTAKHLPLFRKMARYGLTIGIGMGLMGGLIAVTHVRGDNHDGYMLSLGLTMLGNLPACLGYVGLVVVMLHSNSILSKIRELAPAGRMALTNYLMQSLICSLVFYGYGLGYWDMPRALQLVFVLVVFTFQLVFCHWWLARYRFGPAEWLWRGFTYRQLPPMRRSQHDRMLNAITG